MYGLVPYNLSEIQKGIQFGHAVVEYANRFAKNKDYKKWAEHDKTFIILNGGTTNNAGLENEYLTNYICSAMQKWATDDKAGSMQKHALSILDMGVKLATFFEPDLNNTLTGIVFLVDERVWDRTTYPTFQIPDKIPGIWDTMSEATREPFKKTHKKLYDKWVKSIGGPTNEKLRDYLRTLKLA
jgi:hypothetical protein